MVTVEGSSHEKKQKKQNKKFSYYFCNKLRHMKEYSKYALWSVKKYMLLALVCFKVNLAFVPKDTWWVDSSSTIHISMSIQGYFRSQLLSNVKRFIFVGDDNKVTVKAI